MNVIFLDIDGVMNSNIFYHERYNKLSYRIRRWYYWCISWFRLIFTGSRYITWSLSDHVIDPKHFEFDYTFKRLKEETDSKKWKWLSEFCNKNNYKICVSSVWKNHFKEISDWNKALINLGFRDNIFVGITGNRRTDRGTEIKEWLQEQERNKIYWELYAIIDDDSDMLPEQMSSFFHVDGYYGLTPNVLYKIKRHFNKT